MPEGGRRSVNPRVESRSRLKSHLPVHRCPLQAQGSPAGSNRDSDEDGPQIEERLLAGERPNDTSLVFAHPDGSPIHPDYFSQRFDRHLAKSSLPRIRLHDLRHTHATILLKAGVHVKVVSERLGHANVAFTMTVYQHVIPGMQADAARAFSEAVYGRPVATRGPDHIA